MNTRTGIIFLFLFSAVGISCDKDEVSPIESNGSVSSILPLGDSRVEGARPEFESYRYELWKLMVDKDWKFDLVGTRTDPAGYPSFQDKSFDTDHMGTGGATTEDILQQIQEQITNQNAPDVVLLGIGGNDLLGEREATATLETLDQIIAYLQAKNENITILLEQIAPGIEDIMKDSFQMNFDAFNQGIPGIAARRSVGTSRVLVVNMSANWSDRYMADDVHYNEIGAKVVAERYMEALERVWRN